MVGMTIPSFPSQDLAKLVLGYLAEEQLMTAYDEFLHASPYLDALQNEYDRIFMTSLKNILAEYRAVKIYVETCKPFALRKKLCQCANLLEVVKYLINHIDINKIINHDNNTAKFSSDKLHSTTATTTMAKTDCEICNLMKIPDCVCKPKYTEMHASGTQSVSDIMPCQEVETTSLSDLPGNHVTTRKKHVKVLEKDASTSLFNSSCEQQETSSNNSTCVLKNMSSSSSNPCTLSTIENPNVAIKTTESLESQQKIQEFNDVLKLVCNKNTHSSNIQQDNIERRASTAGTFQDFSTGVTGSDNTNVIVPDSSTCDNIHVKVPVTKEASPSINGSNKVKRGPKTQYLLKVANDNDNSDSSSHVSDVIEVDSINGNQLSRIKSNPIKSKVTILSNVKVDNEAITSNLKMPAVLKNATSTPITKMQTILINGTPVYRPTLPMTGSSYTTDEIMAMPTIIITPVSSGPPPLITAQRTLYTTSQRDVAPVIADVAPKSLEPLLIDVSSSITLTTEKSSLPSHPQQYEIDNEACLIKTVDMAEINRDINNETLTSASVPKDNVIPGCTVTSTPQVIPTARKSSSTPRRTSHVRVLDFATPRRILHERIDECETQQSNVAEGIVSNSSSNAIQNVASSVNTIGFNNESLAVTTSTCKEMDKSKTVAKRNKNWDADLRALVAGVQEDNQYDTPKSQSSCKTKSKKKKKTESTLQSKNTDDKKTALKKKPKSKKKKSRSPEKTIEDTKSIHKPVDTQNKERTIIKPTINIVSRNEKDKCNQEIKKAQNKSNSEEHDTPEGDRMPLPNVIDARLNISDLLETPYKQALYDIQMETPKFLGNLPDDPMSDIKIMNIPTPLFLNSSKGTQATPSSYCSRPTDYSSGGSYYKPDDQDYLPLSEHMDCPETLSKEIQNIGSQIDNENEMVDNNENSNRLRPTRPVRQCTKNVSYYNNTNLHIKDKTKDVDESFEEDSSFCDSVNSLSEKKTNKENISKVLKENTPKTKPKSNKGRKISSKNYKSPLKKDASKSFMKIRPRRSTPVKCVKNEKTKRKSSEFSLSLKSKYPARKRTTSKERNAHSTPAVTVAPTKSRRKSSTPRKLHCTKSFNSESSGHNSPDIASKDKPNAPQESHLLCVLDSDTEQLPLRWSDDGSQDAKCKEQQEITANESEDITKIQEYIKTTVSKTITNIETEGSLHIDLVKRGFDVETAKIIERDLLDTPPYPKQDGMFISKSIEKMETKKEDTLLNKTVESESSFSNNLQIVQDEAEADEDEVEFGNFECNEDSANYFTFQHDETKMPPEIESVKLKDKFCMEVCIDDDVTVRLRATPFNMTLDVHPQNEDVIEYNQKEIEAAVRTISEINTPLKESLKAQCFEIFDSTLTSLDTPLKATSPKKKEHTVTVTKIVLEVEKLDVKEKSDSKKRKRIRSGNTSDESVTDTKKVKSDAQYLFNSANIQNIDIESVLSKLHGP